jgi:hypothetical protein
MKTIKKINGGNSVKRKILILVFCIVLVAGTFLTIVLKTSAQSKSLRDIFGIAPDVTSEEASAAIDMSDSVAVESDQLSRNDAIIKEAQALITKAETTYLKEGWLHLSSQTEIFVTTQKAFSDGTPIPTKWTNDSWYLLDEKGMVIKAISIQDTGDPVTSQTSVYQDGMWKNISLGTSDEQESYKLSFDSGFLSSAITYNQINTLSSEETSVQGQNAIVYTITDKYKDPISFGKDDGAKYTAGVIKFYFDRNSGVELQTENYYIREDGSLELSERNLETKIEKINQLPDSLASYFGAK